MRQNKTFIYPSNNRFLSARFFKNFIDKNILSCMIGNALEWYDFIIYGYFATTIGKLFFPGKDVVAQLVATWGIFWLGFITRPLGSLLFGYVGDKISRKTSLTASIYVMAIPTILIGLLPTYQQIGLAATVLLRIMPGYV